MLAMSHRDAETGSNAAPATGRPATAPGFADVTLRLLNGLVADRVAGRAAIAGDILQTLCDIALDLEIAEHTVQRYPQSAHQALRELREHVTAAAASLRSAVIPAPPADRDEALGPALQRCADSHRGRLQVEVVARAGYADPGDVETATWVVREVLEHLSVATAGSAHVSAVAGPDALWVEMTTPGPALDPEGEPDWLLRCRLRASVAGGSVEAGPSPDGSRLILHLPPAQG